MAHGLPDYGINVAKETTFNLADLADLAVRMGSIVEYDRRGDVIYLDDCEAPYPRFRDTSTGTGTARLNTETAYSKIQSIKLEPDAVIGRVARAAYSLAPLVTGKHGIKIAANFLNFHGALYLFVIGFVVYTGTYNLVGGIEITPQLRRIAYWDPDGDPIPFEDDIRIADAHRSWFHNIKLVVDLDTGKYVRLLFDTLSWDMSDFSFYRELNDTAPRNSIEFYTECGVAAPRYNWIDNFVYTINEP